jgi:hypothetical protein
LGDATSGDKEMLGEFRTGTLVVTVSDGLDGPDGLGGETYGGNGAGLASSIGAWVPIVHDGLDDNSGVNIGTKVLGDATSGDREMLGEFRTGTLVVTVSDGLDGPDGPDGLGGETYGGNGAELASSIGAVLASVIGALVSIVHDGLDMNSGVKMGSKVLGDTTFDGI